MRLDEYLRRIARVSHYYKTEGQVADAVSEGTGTERGQVESVYREAISRVQMTIKQNLSLLGIFGPDSEIPKLTDELREKGINHHDLLRHVLKVRHDLINLKPTIAEHLQKPAEQFQSIEFIIVHILMDITNALEVEGLGEVFGKKETDIYRREFKQTSKQKSASDFAPTPTPAPLAKTSARLNITEAQYNELILQLRAQGKVR
jgi:hypothetical protein